MRKYLIPNEGKFYKANLHSHSTVSDGHFTPEEMKEKYMEKGYSIIAFTDHGRLVPHNELTDENFLALNGLEYGVNNMDVEEVSHPKFRKNCDLCMIALEPDNFTTYTDINKEFVFKYTPESINELIPFTTLVAE